MLVMQDAEVSSLEDSWDAFQLYNTALMWAPLHVTEELLDNEPSP